MATAPAPVPVTAPDRAEGLSVRTPLQHQPLEQPRQQQQQQLLQRSSSLPASRSGSRFGQLSNSSFFARHNPHPQRCVHIQGLLGLWIPVVVDSGHQHQHSHRDSSHMPVNAININSQKYPVDTINGLQYFTNLRSVSLKEKAVPRLGLVPITENWREHLRHLTEQTFQPAAFVDDKSVREPSSAELAAQSRAGGRQQQQQQQVYSRDTGRLLPPPSRAMSRKSLRSQRQQRGTPLLESFEHISASPDLEAAVFSMLCQILQTEDFNSVQAWLVSASDRERAMVIDMIRSAVGNKQDYYEVTPRGVPLQESEQVNIRADLKLPPINEQPEGSHGRVDRLVIEDVAADDQLLNGEQRPKQQKQQRDDKPEVRRSTKQQQQQQPKVLKSKSNSNGRPVVAGKGTKPDKGSRPTMKYTKSEPGLQNGDKSNVWKPQESYTK